MNKATTKDGLPTNARRYNVQVIKAIASKRNLNQDFVRQCVRGYRDSETAQQIRKEYNQLALEVANILHG